MATPPVPNRHAKQTRFLAALAQGRTPVEGAALIGVPLPTVYTWRRKHTRFREAWNKAVVYARVPPFPSAAQLAALPLETRTHWMWLPGGMVEGAPPFAPGDRVVRVMRDFCGEPDLLIFGTVAADGRMISETGRASADQPLPEGFQLPAHPVPEKLAARLPPPSRPAPGPSAAAPATVDRQAAPRRQAPGSGRG